MKLAKVSRDELALIIQRRALEIAASEGHDADIPIPAVDVTQDPIGTSAVHWSLSDRQNIRGIAFVWDAAAELSSQYDVQTD
jgi:arginyl-tRNA synthetase